MAALDTIQTTKVFMNGRSQAVRIPSEYRFAEDELFINKIGHISRCIKLFLTLSH